MLILAAFLTGFLLDLLFGDPHWIPHPVRIIGAFISFLERFLRRAFPKTNSGELHAGVVLVGIVCMLSFLVPFAVLRAAQWISPWLRYGLESFWCYQILAAKSLRTESMKVYRRLAANDLPGARKAVSMIVGRDTERLDETGVTKAAVETVAENTSDGVTAPLLFLAIGGAPFGMLYKAVNTMDSMLGYKNERYLYFGRCAAKLDDVFNFVPARLSALLMIAAAYLLRLNYKNAWRIFVRDRRKHPSPNSAQTEAACAGALGVQLAGDTWYFGKLHRKPTIGDALRPVETADIPKANRLMYGTSFLLFLLCAVIRLCFVAFA